MNPLKHLMWTDVFIIATAILSFGEKLLTQYIVGATIDKTGVDLAAVVSTIEANPAVGELIKAGAFGSFLLNILVPALILGVYLFARRLVMKHGDEHHRSLLTFAVNVFFFVFLGLFLQNLGLYIAFWGWGA